MDKQLHDFIPLSIMMNTLTYLNTGITKLKRDVRETADYVCPNSLSDTTTWEELHTGSATRSNLSKSEKNTVYSQIKYSTVLGKVDANISYWLMQI